jgi:epoxyqueuosine reductase QueG
MSANRLLLQTIEQQLGDFVLNSPENFVADLGMMRIFEPPLVAVASAQDAFWERLKEFEVVGPQHLSPAEWLSGAQSVISCFLPFTESVRSANRLQGWPATEWLYGRYEGEEFNRSMRRFLVETVQKAGGRAVAPVLDERFTVVNLRSNWSERHAAFIAGLGTFSLSRSLITSRGSAGRLASLVTDLDFEPTPRPYAGVEEYCIQCGACILRCPPQAIDKNGKDNAVCSNFLQETLLRFKPRYGCGKCQTAVPCEARRPLIP